MPAPLKLNLRKDIKAFQSLLPNFFSVDVCHGEDGGGNINISSDLRVGWISRGHVMNIWAAMFHFARSRRMAKMSVKCNQMNKEV